MAGTTRLFATQFIRIESLLESDPDVDALISDLKRRLSGEHESPIAPANQQELSGPKALREEDLERLAELIASRVCAYLQKTASKTGDCSQAD